MEKSPAESWHVIEPYKHVGRIVKYEINGLVSFNDMCIPVPSPIGSNFIQKVRIYFDDFLFDEVSSEEVENDMMIIGTDKGKFYSWRTIAQDRRLRMSYGGFLYNYKKTHPDFISPGLVGFLSEMNLKAFGVQKFKVVIMYENSVIKPLPITMR